VDFIEILLSRISKEISDIFLNLISGEVHSLKRNFSEKFENVVSTKILNDSELMSLVKNARKFLKDFINHLPSYRLDEPSSINIVPLIKRHLLREKKSNGNLDELLPNEVNVAGYDGIYEDYLKPMLIEIRSNAEKALSDLPEDKQHYQVILKKGENSYSGYGILSVINNYIERDKITSTDHISTGTGLRNIQYYAPFFQLGARQGWAQFQSKNDDDKNLFEVQIYFPLWEDSIKDIIHDAT
jgi:hypothetical protein